MRKTVLLILFLLIFPFIGQAAVPEAPRASTLTLEDCLRLAFEHHPDIVSSAWQVRRSEARVEEAKSSLRPNLEAGSTLLNTGGSNRISSSVSVKQLLTDGGKSRATVAGASHDFSATLKDAERTWQERAYTVKEAYFSLLRSREDAAVAAETASLYETQLAQARAFYQAGSKSRIDVTTAEVNLSQARLDQARAESSFSVAVATLENEIGAGLPDRKAFLVTPKEKSLPAPALETALAEALRSRPDVLAGEERILSARQTLTATAKGLSPSLYVSGAYERTDNVSNFEDEWNAVLSLSIPLYDGGATAARTEASRADFEISRSDQEKLKQQVRLEVERAMLELQTASVQVETAEAALRQARENLDLARGRYRVGVGTSLEVTDAGEKYSSARKSLVQARYDLQVSATALEKALGRPVEIPKEETK